MNGETKRCSECKSDYFIDSSEMTELCPECAHKLYGYEKCNHDFENGRCKYCNWNGQSSEFLNNKPNSKS